MGGQLPERQATAVLFCRPVDQSQCPEMDFHLIKGMALYNKKQYALALNQLAEAEKHQKSRAMAQQWKQFVQGEKRQADAIAAELGTS